MKYYGLSGWDMFKFKMHGKCQYNIKEIELNLHTKRNIKKHDPFLRATVEDFNFIQNHNFHELFLRNLLIKKVPLKAFETPLFKLPQLELQFNIT